LTHNSDHEGFPLLKLPSVPQSSLNVLPIEWGKLPKHYLNAGELEVLVALVRSAQPKGVLEIGVNTGRTARALLDNVPGIERYQGIDVPPGYAFACRVQRNEVPTNPGHYALQDHRFELVLRPRGSFDLTPADLRPCDVVFIDGDHGRAAVMHDTALAVSLLRPGGLIIWHDYHDFETVEVRDALHELQATGMPIQHVAGTWIAYARPVSILP
jgi:spermidine synthase